MNFSFFFNVQVNAGDFKYILIFMINIIFWKGSEINNKKLYFFKKMRNIIYLNIIEIIFSSHIFFFKK
jgi:hypothetical protein